MLGMGEREKDFFAVDLLMSEVRMKYKEFGAKWCSKFEPMKIKQ